MSAKIAVIQFPGSNCEREVFLALTRVGVESVPFLWNESHAKLRACDGFIIVGGFSYEDRSRAGIVAALDPILSVLREAASLGKPMLGICNGAQILVETGLVPGAKNHVLSMALMMNKRVKDHKVLGTGYYNAWVNLCLGVNAKPNAFNKHIKSGDVLRMPVAHAEGRYVMPEATLQALKDNGLIAFQYCDEKAEVIDTFPVNPNGSMANVAGVVNARGNVMSLMPHPERTSLCDAIFASMRDYILEGRCYPDAPLAIDVKPQTLMTYQAAALSKTVVVDLLITDNHAVTIQNALELAGIPVTVKRKTHWEIEARDVNRAFAQIEKSGELFNMNKEAVVEFALAPNSRAIIVRGHDDMIGRSKQQLLTDHFGVEGLEKIHHGVLWEITAKTGNDIVALMPKVLATNLLYNPFGQDGYEFV